MQTMHPRVPHPSHYNPTLLLSTHISPYSKHLPQTSLLLYFLSLRGKLPPTTLRGAPPTRPPALRMPPCPPPSTLFIAVVRVGSSQAVPRTGVGDPVTDR